MGISSVMNIRVGIAQITPTLGDIEANLDRYSAQVEQACRENCQLIIFPELTLTGYFLKDVVPDVALNSIRLRSKS